MQSIENWLPVRGYEGFYEVSDHGRVRSRRRQGAKGGILRQNPDTRGHMNVNLHKKGEGARVGRVHRMVLEAFVGPCPAGHEALHWDDRKTNNLLTNLRWGTRSENQFDRVRNGIHPFARRTECSNAHPLSGPNLRFERPNARGSSPRVCRACRAGRAAAKRLGQPFTKEISDEWYARIMARYENGVAA